MNFMTRFLAASAKALDDHILRGGPFPNDEVLVKIDPELAVLMRDADDDDEPRWIPVRERLPEQTTLGPCVLAKIRCEYLPVVARRLRSGAWEGIADRRTFFAWEVTHWMPLPAPPEAP